MSKHDKKSLDALHKSGGIEKCAALGCNNRGIVCACNAECDRFGDCCTDYAATCAHSAPHGGAHERAPQSCREVGCGHIGRGGSCSCNEECRKFHDCCHDFESVCTVESKLLRG